MPGAGYVALEGGNRRAHRDLRRGLSGQVVDAVDLVLAQTPGDQARVGDVAGDQVDPALDAEELELAEAGRVPDDADDPGAAPKQLAGEAAADEASDARHQHHPVLPAPVAARSHAQSAPRPVSTAAGVRTRIARSVTNDH